MTELRTFHPRRPTTIDPTRVVARYDAPSDTLLVHFTGTGRPGVSVPADVVGDALWRVDPETDEIVGLQLEGFRHAGYDRRAPYAALGALVGSTPQALAVESALAALFRALPVE